MDDDHQPNKSGFGNPPSEHRFKKGQSGNRKGRPKGTRNLKTDLAAMLNGNVEITVNGIHRRMTRQEAMLLSLFQRAVSKETGAAKTLLDLVVKLLPPDSTPEIASVLSQSDQNIIDSYLRRIGYIIPGAPDDEPDSH